ncbi:MAG: 50S ribosomal protein L24 [Erysipelotrichaceae bacterium]|nr:50S ribosomal protein L24 [Erysipelotrichaceae bacterium]
MKIKKGDKVQVITGQDKGTVGEVLAAFPKADKIVVEGVNIRRKHQKPSNANPDGGIIDKECPIHVSNVKLSEGKKAGKKATKKTDKKGGKK